MSRSEQRPVFPSMSAGATSQKPVQLSGWYELTDGRVAYYYWIGNALKCGDICANWAEVERLRGIQDELTPEQTEHG